MTDEETRLFMKIVDPLAFYFGKNSSIVAKVYGVYRLHAGLFQNMNLMVMKNSIKKVFPLSEIIYTFDMKGSSIKRGVITKTHKG